VLYLVAIPVFFLIIVLAEPVVQVWLGNDYTLAARAIQFLLLGNLFSLLVTPQYIILQGIGMPQLSTLVAAVNGFANVVIALIFVQIMGYYGVLLAVMLTLLSASILMIYLFHRATDYSFLEYIRAWPLKMLSISCVLAGCLFVISKNVNNRSTFGFAAAFSIFYVLTLIWLLKEDDKKLFNKLKSAILFPIFKRIY
jgi:O-antigen/teichoic acid export membrane protein